MNFLKALDISAAENDVYDPVPWGHDWLATWSPYHDTLKGSTLGSGCWYKDPVEIANDDTMSLGVMKFADRMWHHYDVRGLMSNKILDPNYDPLARNNLGMNGWDVMHDTHSRLLGGLANAGYEWASNTLWRILQSKWNSVKWGKYLRMEDDPKKPYGTGGRLRVAGWMVDEMVNALEDAQRRVKQGKKVDGNLVTALAALLSRHLHRIREHLPLTADPKGDHLPVPHVEVFMAGILYHSVKRCRDKGYEVQVCADIMGHLQSIIMFAHIPEFGDARFAYDLAIDDYGLAYYHPLTLQSLTGDEQQDKIINGRRPNGIGSVNAWICEALQGTPKGDALVADAVKEKWETELPMFWNQWVKP